MAERRDNLGAENSRVCLNPDAFIADVVNSVNDLIVSGFDSFEEFATELLPAEAARCALRDGIDKIYDKVQDNVDEHLYKWEAMCRANYFNTTSETRILSSSDNESATSRNSTEAAGIEELLLREQTLDKELLSLRSQLITAEREASRMRRELVAGGREVVGDSEKSTKFPGAILEEVLRSAVELKEKMDRLNTVQRKRSRHRFVPSMRSEDGEAELNLTPGSKELVLRLRKVTDITADQGLQQLLTQVGSSDDVVIHG